MSVLKSNWAVGWNAQEQIHNASLVKQVILGEAMSYLMSGGDEQTRRFASSVLDKIGFTQGALGERDASKGDVAIHSTMEAKDIDYIHRKYASEIYSKHLAKPFMSDGEFAKYITEETLRDNGKQEFLDLLEKDIHKTFGVRL
uniref:Uncharacterized protein n=1 Tax=uncultured prokaryote TaxID=198431 RepID=A0A0H5PYC8_9ZZZZ|nr:hypothetical protein [uncultured prokaryote]